MPESMLDVREYCSSHNLKPSADMDLEKMKKIVQDDFGAQIGIWGSIERAPGEEGEIYDLAIKCVDFSAQPSPKVLYEVKARTNSTGEIPHLYVKQMLDALYGRQPGGTAASDPAAEENWKNGPNLVVGGDFEHGSGGVPKGWAKVAGQFREPVGRMVKWLAEEGNPGNKVIHFTLDRNTAENEGLMYYSEYFPVEEGAKYRFQVRWRSTGPSVKVFIKCYDEMGSPYRAEAKKSGANAPKGKAAHEGRLCSRILSTPRGLSQPAGLRRLPPRSGHGPRTPRTLRPNIPSTRPSGAASCYMRTSSRAWSSSTTW